MVLSFFPQKQKNLAPTGEVAGWIKPKASDSSIQVLLVSFSGPDRLYNLLDSNGMPGTRSIPQSYSL